MKTIIERGASWTLEETKLLLALWGQDLVSRQATCQKRTKEVYEKISEKFNQNGFERTPDQVRTRVFNMIAEYRRILKDPNPERMKKCIFFETLDKIYNAKHLSDVKSAIDDYEPSNPYSPSSTNSKPPDMMLDSDSEALMDGHDDNSTSMDANSMSNNNSNSASTTNKSATTNNNNNNNDTTNSATSNNSSGDGNHNNKTSATSDNIANSINDNTPSKRTTPAGKEGSGGSQSGAVKRIKTEISSPKAGTSQGEQQANSENSTGGDMGTAGGLSKQPSSSKNSPSNQSNGPTMSTANTSTISANKQQSLLASSASSSSSSSTPISKLTSQAGSNSAGSYINLNSTTKLPILRSQFLGHSNGNESVNMNGTQQTARLPTTAAITGHQLYQAPVNTFDVTSSALLIDRMFAHLARESENMREWIALEKERIAVERTRRSQEAEREIRRERVLIDTLLKFQDSWISFVSSLDPRLIEGAAGQMPELKIPPREASDSQHSHQSMTQTPPGCSSVSQQTVSLNTSCSANTSISSIATGTSGGSNSSTATLGTSLSSNPLAASGAPNLIAPSAPAAACAPVAGSVATSTVATTSTTTTTTTTTNPAVTNATTVPTTST